MGSCCGCCWGPVAAAPQQHNALHPVVWPTPRGSNYLAHARNTFVNTRRGPERTQHSHVVNRNTHATHATHARIIPRSPVRVPVVGKWFAQVTVVADCTAAAMPGAAVERRRRAEYACVLRAVLPAVIPPIPTDGTLRMYTMTHVVARPPRAQAGGNPAHGERRHRPAGRRAVRHGACRGAPPVPAPVLEPRAGARVVHHYPHLGGRRVERHGCVQRVGAAGRRPSCQRRGCGVWQRARAKGLPPHTQHPPPSRHGRAFGGEPRGGADTKHAGGRGGAAHRHGHGGQAVPGVPQRAAAVDANTAR